jgi:hypothetical protein
MILRNAKSIVGVPWKNMQVTVKDPLPSGFAVSQK